MRAKDIQMVADVAQGIVRDHKTLAEESAAFLEGVETVLGELAHRLEYSQSEVDVTALREAIKAAQAQTERCDACGKPGPVKFSPAHSALFCPECAAREVS